MRRRLPAVLILVAALILPVSLAYASPPDQIWVQGVYDAADYDDAVVGLTSVDASSDCTPPAIVGIYPVALGFAPLGDTSDTAAAAFPTFHTRAPPTLEAISAPAIVFRGQCQSY